MDCGRSFSWNKLKNESEREPSVQLDDFVDFYDYVVGKRNKACLSEDGDRSTKTLTRKFSYFFNSPPHPQAMWRLFPPRVNDHWIYGVDGTWLKRHGVILVHKNALDNQILWWSYAPSESYEAFGKDLNSLSRLVKTKPYGAISDWKGAIIGTVKAYFGNIPHQRCLAHVSRELKKLLPSHSPLDHTQALRKVGLNGLRDILWV